MQDDIVISNKSFTSSENPIPATEYYVWNSQNITINIFLVIIIVFESKELGPLNQAAFQISDRLYSIAQLGCETGLSVAFKYGRNFQRSYEPECVATQISPRLFHTT